MKINEWTLSNGAKCVLARMKDSTLTCIDFWCKAGSIYEDKNEEGMAHFLEHMIFKGSKNLLEGEFDLRIESLGGSSNAATGLDDVHYHVLVPPEYIEEALRLLLELLLFPEIEQNAFDMEKEVVLEEIAQNIEQPDEIIYMKLLKELSLLCGEERPIQIARELTKKHEEQIGPTIGKALKYFGENKPRGEFTIVLGGASTKEVTPKSDEELIESMQKLISNGLSKNIAAKQLAYSTGYPKNYLYSLININCSFSD